MASRRGPFAALTRVALAVIGLTVLSAPALASPEEDLAAAQRRANRAAEELADAEEQMALAQDSVARAQTRVERVEARVARVRDQVRQLAVRLYVDGTAPITRVLRVAHAGELVRVQQYSQVIAGTSTDSLRQYRTDREDLRQELTSLEREREAQESSLDNLRRRRQEAVREIERLSEVVAQARAAREAEFRAQTPAPASTPAPPASPGGNTESPPSPPDGSPRPPVSSPPVTTGPTPAGAASGEWICPVQGPRAFSNDYGAPRGGGSSHQGNDILAPRGTPVVASVAGVVTQRNGAVSGLAYFLDGDDGTRYFGAHLDSFGASGRVAAGTVIGTVGNTGDAAGGPPHLHFEMHPGGRGNINPYSTLTRYC